MASLTIHIDNRTVNCEPGQTVLQAARRAGIFIPNLCHHDELPALNACNLCVVEIEKREGCPTACTTPIAHDMVVHTDSPRLLEFRYQALKRMLANHPDPCILCDSRDDCEQFQDREGPSRRGTAFACAQRGLKIGGIAVDPAELGIAGPAPFAPEKVESKDPFVARDYNYCVDCGLCWRACEQVQDRPRPEGQATEWAARIKALGTDWAASGCNYCGACVDICPAGALVDRYAQEQDISTLQPVTICTICSLACPVKAVLSEGQIVSMMVPKYDHRSRICALGRFAYARILGDPQRLKTPMVRADDELAPVEWSQALQVIAQCLKPYQDGTFVAIIGQTETRENALMYELFTRHAMNGQVVAMEHETRAATLELLEHDIRTGRVKAAIVAGNYLDAQTMAGLEYMVVADFHETRACDIAEAVLPVAILSELEGTTRTADGKTVRLKKVVEPPGQARAEWTFLSELAGAMGCDLLQEVSAKLNGMPLGQSVRDLHPRDTTRELPHYFRGHLVADIVPELRVLGLPFTPENPPGDP